MGFAIGQKILARVEKRFGFALYRQWIVCFDFFQFDLSFLLLLYQSEKKKDIRMI